MERLRPTSTVVLVVDIQEKLAAAMPPETLAEVVKNTGILLDAAKAVGAAVLASEQYPKGLGPTVSALAGKLEHPPMPKMTFDAASDLAISRRLAELGPSAVVVVGMESHVCVFQTAHELVKRGYTTHVVADAVCSRKEENRRLGLALAERTSAIVTATETVCFDWLERAGTDAFKTVSKLVR